MRLVNTQLKGQEQDLHSTILVALLNLELLLLDMEGLWDAEWGRCTAGTTSASCSLLLLICGTSFASSGFTLISSLALGSSSTFASFDYSIALVLDRNIEENFFIECIVDLKVDLEGFVQLS